MEVKYYVCDKCNICQYIDQIQHKDVKVCGECNGEKRKGKCILPKCLECDNPVECKGGRVKLLCQPCYKRSITKQEYHRRRTLLDGSKYTCEKCNFKTYNPSTMEKHKLTKKHIRLTS